MKRRHFLALAGAAPYAAKAQTMRRVALLTGLGEEDPASKARIAAFRAAMAALGWHEGQNLALDLRYEPSSVERARKLVTELYALKPEVGVMQGLPAANASRAVDAAIPVVFVAVPDPVSMKLIDSLARPGGNMTGVTSTEPSFGAKWIELLKEIAPATQRLLVLSQQNPVIYKAHLGEAARHFGAELSFAQVNSEADIQSALDGFAAGGAGGGLVLPTDLFTAARRKQIIALSAQHRLPLITGNPPFPADGGLMYYGADFVDLYRRAAGYVDRILKGNAPANLPVQQPTTFQMSINLKTAAALGLTVPATLRARADEVFE